MQRLISPAKALLNHAKISRLRICMTNDSKEKVFLTTTGFAEKQALAELQKHNVATGPLLRQAGLPGQNADPAFTGSNAVDNRISAVGQSKFLDLAAEAIGDSAFGLRLAEQANPRDAGVLFYVVSGGKNIDEALKLFVRYHRIANQAARIKLVQTAKGVALEADFFGLPAHSTRHNAEFGLAVVLKALREVAGRKISPTRVAFAHPRNSDLKEFERFFLCPVEFGRASIEGASEHLIEFSNETLATPLFTADPKLIEALKPFCDAAAQERGAGATTLRFSIEREIEKLLPNGKAQAENVAKALALSVRTMSRRLADEGTTYAEIVDKLRRGLALQYLKDQTMSLSQIAWLLGYEGSTSFNHAFKRWTGRSPSAARNEKQLTASRQNEREPV
jgi:AraC-like DNA-binding protein